MTKTPIARAGATVGLRIDPLDVLFFRDGRPFTPASRGASGLPTPQTLAGAVRTHLLQHAGCDFDALGELVRSGQSFQDAAEQTCAAGWVAAAQIRGPWLARGQDEAMEVLVPAPATVHEAKAGPAPERWLLAPLPAATRLPGWDPPEQGMRPLWSARAAPGKRSQGYLTPSGLGAFLRGEAPQPDAVVSHDQLYGFDRRTGVGITPDRLSAEEGLLYSANMLALKDNVAFYAELVLPHDAPADPLPASAPMRFGGESRHVTASTVKPFEWPDASPQNGQGVVVMLTTPALFDANWRPSQWPDGLELVAAAVPGYDAVSGWDLARRGPKPNRFAAQAGSVYFLQGESADWPTTLTDDDTDAPLGWGCFVKGVWNDG